MRVICASCGQALNMPEPFKATRYRCPKCKTVADVPHPADDTLGGTLKSVRASHSKRAVPTSLPVGKVVSPPAVPVTPQSRDAWHLQTEDGQKFGPITKSELDAWVTEHRVTPRCQVLRDGDTQWQRADQVYPALKVGASDEATSDTVDNSSRGEFDFLADDGSSASAASHRHSRSLSLRRRIAGSNSTRQEMRFRLMPVIVGWAVSFGVEIVLGSAVGIVLGATELKNRHHPRGFAQLMQDDTYLIVSSLVALLAVAVGGFTTAWLARPAVFKHVLAMCLLSHGIGLLLTVMYLTAGLPSPPEWVYAAGFLRYPVALLGGSLAAGIARRERSVSSGRRAPGLHGPGTQAVLAVSERNVGVAVLLTVLFGPLGMLYSTITGGLIMLVIGIVLFCGIGGLFTAVTGGIGAFVLIPLAIMFNIGCAIWAAVAAHSHNEKHRSRAQRGHSTFNLNR